MLFYSLFADKRLRILDLELELQVLSKNFLESTFSKLMDFEDYLERCLFNASFVLRCLNYG
ncbi:MULTISPECIES: hypothetical protein [spotted fever group]|uniref:hypothetical protein n=1 Tax=spotted fever group TaxID=114277 RepID=UPI00135C3284|nr:hypothetical protein [Rickettsia endosymbiont of Ixodes scapularis]